MYKWSLVSEINMYVEKLINIEKLALDKNELCIDDQGGNDSESVDERIKQGFIFF